MNKSVMAICVNSAGASLPPVSTDLTNTASVTTTGNNALSFSSGFAAYGISFRSGVGGTTISGNIGISSSSYFENCEFELGSTSTSGSIDIGTTTTGNGYVEWNNCRLKLQNTSQRIVVAFSEFLWRDSPNFLTGVTPTGLLNLTSANGARAPITLRNMDLSALTAIAVISNAGYVLAENCKLHASLTIPSTNTFWGVSNPLRLHNCDPGTSGNIGFNITERSPDFLMLTDPLVYRAGGASDGVNPYSLQYTMNSGVDRLSRRSRSLMRLEAIQSYWSFSNLQSGSSGVCHVFAIPQQIVWRIS